MKTLLLALVCFFTSQANATTINFDTKTEKEILKEWETGFYGSKGNPKWSVEKFPSSPSKENVFLQKGEATYIWNVYKNVQIKDGFIEAKINILSGKEDPEAGVVWRHLDGKNYYYVRANALEKNIVFYRMNNGKKELVKVADAKVNFNQWYKIRVNFNKNQIEVLFDNKPLINVKDNVFWEKGRVGLFTTADTQSAFDDLNFDSL